MQITSQTLKRLRTGATMSQDDLAEASGVSKKTIARIETGKHAPHPTTIQRLAMALKVRVDDLTREPTEKEDGDFLEAGLRPLKTWIDGETALSFQMVEDVYGIPLASQVDMAPLFAAVLAEASLEWRRKRLAEIDDAAERLMSLGAGHLSFANAAYHVEDAAIEEGLSISSRDVFGKAIGEAAFDYGYDPSSNNPFADFLKYFVKSLGKTQITVDQNETGKLNETGFPDYRIAPDRIEELTGGEAIAEHALLRGHAVVSDIPKELLKPENRAKRAEWLSSRVPDQERARLKAQQEFLSTLIVEAFGSTGGDDAA
jgi:transcriptional regulator with XRE-family HTH domain